MADNNLKPPRKRPCCAPERPAKTLLIECPTGQKPLPKSSPRRVVLYTSSNELLGCLGRFIRQKFYKLKDLSSTEPIDWLRNIDHFLLINGYQGASFLSSGSAVFLYMLCRDLISPEVGSVEELRAYLFTCCFITCCYIGKALTYPLKPFLVESSNTAFWDRCLSYIRIMSTKMMRINIDRQFYSVTLAELKAVGE